jgi:hypothetical protein
MADDTETILDDAFPAGDALGTLKPYAVPIKTAQKLLAEKPRSEIYKAIGRGELDAIKDGAKTLIVLASIERRQAALPRANIKALPPLIRKRGGDELIGSRVRRRNPRSRAPARDRTSRSSYSR